jgi:hypothetical protein
MATIPASRGPQLRTAPLQFVPQQGARSDAAFGGIQGRQLEALGRAGMQAASDFDRIAENQAQTQAFDVDAKITGNWLQWQSENKGRYLGANAEGYTAAVEEFWQKAASDTRELDGRVKAKVEKALVNRKLDAMRSATSHVMAERERHADQAFAADLTATAEFGVTTGDVDFAARELRGRVAAFAARRGWTPEMVQVETTKALTQLHGLKITSLLDTDPDAAKAHLLKATAAGELDARSRIAFERAVEQAGTLSKAQRLADDVVQRGLTLDQGLKEAESLSGEAERVAKAELRQRFADAEASRREAVERHYGTALLQVEQSGRVKPSTFALLDDKHKAAVLNRIQAEAKAREAAARDKPIKTDWNTYATLREQADTDPAAFAKADLRQYLDKIGPAQFEQLLDVQSRLRKPEKDPKRRSEQTVNAWVSDFASGLDLDTVKQAQFRSVVHDEIRAQEAQLGRDLKDEEITSILDRALLRQPGWFQKRNFESAFQERKRNATSGTTAPPPAAPVRVNTPEEARALPPGTRFQTPDGRVLVR